VWRLALPTGTELLGGDAGINRGVLWARRMSVHPPAFGALEDGDMGLLSLQALALLDERLTLSRVVAALAGRGASAVGVMGQPSAAAVEEANLRALPLFSLPPTSDLRDIEHDIIRLIVEQEAQVDRRRQEIQQEMTRISIENGGVAAITAEASRITRKVAAVHDGRGTIEALSGAAEHHGVPPPIPQMLIVAEPDRSSPFWDHGSAGRPSVDSVAVPGTAWARHTSAITVDDEVVGYLSLLGEEEADDLDRLVLAQGALACALEVVKERAVAAAEDRMRGDFLGALLTSDNAREPALGRRAVEVGYAIDGYHGAAVFHVEPPSARIQGLLASEFRALLLGTGMRSFICPHEGNLAALCQCADLAVLRQMEVVAQQVWQSTRDRLETGHGRHRVAIGLGRPAGGLSGLRTSLVQAQEAVALANELFEGDRVLSFADLGIYNVLFRLQGSRELEDFYDRTLGPLLRYDAGRGTQLVDTLEAFFGNMGNVSQTAEALYLHRNSLLYRLERIGEITGLDLNDPDDRFSLQLALRLRTVVSPPRQQA
jgi:purine catabolism regulator